MSPPRILIPVVLVVGGVAAWLAWREPKATDDGSLVASGTVEATDAQLGFQMPGRIAVLQPREGEAVVAGAEIARLDAAELEARRAQAVAAVTVAEAVLAEVEAGSRREEIAQARAALAAADERVADATRDRDRAAELLAGKALTREAFDKTASAVETATAQREGAREALKLVEKGPRPERIATARAALAQAEAAVATVDAGLAQTRLVAPFAGVVTVRHREPGEIVGAGSPVVTLTDLGDRWVRIYVPENRLGAVRLGQAASITADTFPGRTYDGEVAFLASEAEFTPKNVQTTEERVRLVYAVKVRISGDAAHELKPGLPADVRLLPSP